MRASFLKALAAIVLLILVVVVASVLFLARGRATKIGGKGELPPFPYWKNILPPSGQMFEALCADRPDIRRIEGKPVMVRHYPEDYMKSDAISNHFTEDARIDCRFAGRPSPREMWMRQVGSKSLFASELEAREAVYSSTRECNTFNPAYARWIIEYTAGKGARVLDPSAGWGDRLIGAIAADAAVYHGFDPNQRLQEGYSEIVQELAGGNAAYHVKLLKFEEAKLQENFYDIALSSPPYFTLEDYEPEAGADQAKSKRGAHRHERRRGLETAKGYGTYEQWLRKMYHPYLRNSYRAVRPGGWVAIYVEDWGGRQTPGQHHPQYPLREETIKVLAGLGAERRSDLGLLVEAASAPNQGRIRWAVLFKKPETA